MMKNSSIFFWVVALVVLAFACTSRKADYSEFNQFYDKFMQDSLFQVQHIQFPMEGLPDNAAGYEGELPDFRWTAENWHMHRPIDFQKSKFVQNFETLGDELIIENISDRDSGYGMMRRWAKIGGEWSLIYYVGINPLQEKQ